MEPIQITEEQKREIAKRVNEWARKPNPFMVMVAEGKIKLATHTIPKWIEGSNADHPDHAVFRVELNPCHD